MISLKLTRRIGGTILFTIGVISLLLPFVPGWLLIVLGLYTLSIDSPGLTDRLDALCARYPTLHRIRASGHRLLGHILGSDPK